MQNKRSYSAAFPDIVEAASKRLCGGDRVLSRTGVLPQEILAPLVLTSSAEYDDEGFISMEYGSFGADTDEASELLIKEVVMQNLKDNLRYISDPKKNYPRQCEMECRSGITN